MAVALYILQNIFYAAFSYIGGWLVDHFAKKWLLAAGFSLGAVMTLCVSVAPVGFCSLSLIFVLGGMGVALEETLEDSYCAELVEEKHRGMAFGELATVNGIGDFLSSIIVGLLWAATGIPVAFAYSAVLSVAGAWLVTSVKDENPKS